MTTDAVETLQPVIDQVLHDISRAQLAVARRSERIAGIYGETPILQSLPVPYMQISSVDIDLRYALVHREDQPSRSSQSPATSEKAIADAARRLAIAANDIVRNIAQSGQPSGTDRAEESRLDNQSLADSLVRSLSTLSVLGESTNPETGLSTESVAPRSAQPETFQEDEIRLPEEFDAKAASARHQVVLNQLFGQLWRALAERDSLLCDLMDSDLGIEELRRQVITAWLPIVQRLDLRLRGEDGSESATKPRYAVVVDAHQLAELPEAAVSSVSLHIDLADRNRVGADRAPTEAQSS